MKRLICVALCFTLLPLWARAETTQKPQTVSAKAAVVLDAATGVVLFQKNADTPLAVASTTKIMTTLLLLEQGNLEETVTVNQEWIQVEGTSMGLAPGDTLTRQDLCYGMMLSSGNDAAGVAAMVHSGGFEEFAGAMNQKAAALGMNNTRFVTPSGLDEGDPYSSAYDMALLTAYALNNPTFAQMAACQKVTLTYGNPPCSRTLTNHNRLLTEYEGCIGVKTGFTKKAGRCLVSAAKRDGATLICVTLNAPDDWNDHKQLLDYGFSLTEPLTHPGGEISLPLVGSTKEQAVARYPDLTCSIPSSVKRDLAFRFSLPHFLYAPLKAGEKVGNLELTYKGTVLARVPVTVTEEAHYRPLQPTFWQKFFENFRLFFG